MDHHVFKFQIKAMIQIYVIFQLKRKNHEITIISEAQNERVGL